MNLKNKTLKISSLFGSKAIKASSVFIAAMLIVGGFFVAANHAHAAGAITVTATTNTKVYDGTTSASAIPTLTLGTLDPDDVATYSETYDTEGVGTNKTLTPSVIIKNSLDVDVTGSYTITYVNDTTGVITKATPTLSVTNSPVIYDGATHAATVSGSVAGVVSNVLTGGSAAQTNADTYAVTADFAPTDSTNYNSFTGASAGDFVINKVILTITGTTAVTKIYDGNTTASVTPGTLSGFVGSETVTVASSIGTFDTPNVGAGKTVTVSYTLADGTNGGLASNYSLANTATTADITAKTITATADTQTKVYGDADPALTYTNDPLVGSDTFTGSLARVAGENVGTYAITQGNLALSSNYTLTYVSANLTTIARPITVTAVTDAKVYDGTTTSIGAPTITSGSLASGDTVTWTQAYDTGNVGTGKTLTPAGTVSDGNSGNNYSYAFVTDTTGVITQAPLTITAEDKSKVYGTTNPTFTASYSGFVNSEISAVLDTPVLLSTSADATSPVSGYAITASDATDANYNITFVPGTLTVTAAPITVTTDAQTKVYGDADPELTYQITSGSIITGDTFTGSLSRAVGENVGAYAITSTLDNSNYNITFEGADFTVTAKSITVTADTQSKVYGDAEPTLTYTHGVLANGDTDLVFTGLLARAAGENVATYAVNQGTLNAGGNYTVAFTGADFNITAKDITVTATAENKVYDGNTSATFTLDVTGIVGSDDVSATGGTASFADKNVFNGIGVTASGYTLTGAQAGNYSINNPTTMTTADITAKPITLTININNKTYDGDTSAAYSSTDPRVLNGVIVGDTVVAENTGSKAFENKNVGADKTVTVTGVILSGADKDNYDFDGTGTGTATINARPITVTVVTDTKVYDGTDSSSATPTITNTGSLVTGPVMGGDTANFIQTFDTKNAGMGKTLTPSGSVTDDNGGNNYTITLVADTTGEIIPVTLTATITADNKIYDGSTVATITGRALIGVLLGDDVTANEDGIATFDDANVGAGKIVSAVGITTTGVDASNYDYNGTATGLADITSLEITITPDANQSKVYGDTDPAFTYTFDSLIGGDTFFGVLGRTEGENVSTYEYALGDLSAGGNYALTLDPGTFEITQKSITVTADDKSKIYGATIPDLTASYSGFILGEDESVLDMPVSLSTTADDTSSVGAYEITASDATDANYNITFVPGTLTVTPAPITVTADATSKTYGDADPALTYTNDPLVGSDAFTGSLARVAGENLGTYAITQGTLALSSNYDLTFVGANLTIGFNTIGFNTTVALTQAGQWALISAPTLLSQAPTVTDDESGAIALLVYRNGAFVVPSAGDEELVNPLNAFYIKTTSTGKVGLKFTTVGSPTQVSKQLSAGWNLVGTNNPGLAENEFSSIQNTPTNAGMVTLYVPDTYNSRKDTGYNSWGENANHDLNANPVTALPDDNLSEYDGYWIFMDAVKAFVKNL